MSFDIFKEELESCISEAKFELLEFHYLPYNFGSGLLAYRIKGRNYRFTFDGKEMMLKLKVSHLHEKYFGCKWEKEYQFEDMNSCLRVINEIIMC